ncbi:MAG: hypothetical protein ACK4PR_13630 [Gammaproteobacteria bacterium]
MKDNEIKSFYIVNEKVDIAKVKQELSAVMPMVDSMLQLVAEELNDVVKSPTRLWYLHAWIQHMQITLEIYQRAYDDIASTDNIGSSTVLLINPTLDSRTLRDTATSHIHQLQSLSHLAAYTIFDGCVNSHLQNSLLIINNYMQRAVNLIDLLMLDSFKPVKE